MISAGYPPRMARGHGSCQHHHDRGPVRASVPRRDGPLRGPPERCCRNDWCGQMRLDGTHDV